MYLYLKVYEFTSFFLHSLEMSFQTFSLFSCTLIETFFPYFMGFLEVRIILITELSTNFVAKVTQPHEVEQGDPDPTRLFPFP